MTSAAPKFYLLALVVLLAAVFSAVFAFNFVLDPLWYSKGNRVTKQNYAFNERLAKMNRFLQAPEQYDCFIFGSSRTTLLDEKQVAGYTCFNFSFSLGRIGEFEAYAKYLQARGYKPRLVVVSVEDFNFLSANSAETVPDFVLDNTAPPGIFYSYLSIDAFRLSRRTLRGDSPYARYYKDDFAAAVLPGTPPYEPAATQPREQSAVSASFSPENAAWYRGIARIFPGAKVVFYVPPISVWRLQEFERAGQLGLYLKALHAVAAVGPDLYDFSIPSSVTRDKSLTYDGSHFSVAINDRIAASLATGIPAFGIRLNGLSFEDYERRFLEAMRDTSF